MEVGLQPNAGALAMVEQRLVNLPAGVPVQGRTRVGEDMGVDNQTIADFEFMAGSLNREEGDMAIQRGQPPIQQLQPPACISQYTKQVKCDSATFLDLVGFVEGKRSETWGTQESLMPQRLLLMALAILAGDQLQSATVPDEGDRNGVPVFRFAISPLVLPEDGIADTCPMARRAIIG